MTWEATGRFLGTPGRESARERFAQALRTAKERHRHSIKETARNLGRTAKAAERILYEDNSPQLDAVIAACRAYDEVWDEFKALCGRANDVSEAEQIVAQMTAVLREKRR